MAFQRFTASTSSPRNATKRASRYHSVVMQLRYAVSPSNGCLKASCRAQTTGQKWPTGGVLQRTRWRGRYARALT
jgi:hypothetical protein